MKKDLKEKIHLFQSPGRVNLIGEHIDYSGGHVLPVAVDRSIFLSASIRNDRLLKFKSLNFNKEIVRSLDDITFRKEDDWANYPKGVVKLLQDSGHRLQGMDLLYEGNIPIGAGLSSSAAIELVTCYAFCSLCSINMKREDMALLCQKAENEFVGMRCGIMDQFIISLGQKGHALFLNCQNLNYELIPFKTNNVSIVVGNTNKKRNLVNSEYNKRRKDCEDGLEILRKYLDVGYLCDVTPLQFEEYRGKLPDIIRRRCEHAVYENERVKKSVSALKKNDIDAFGNLLMESHNSLRDLYEVSCPELDIMVEESLKVEGVFGSRLTGAGFGGCTLSLVRNDRAEYFIQQVSERYYKRTKIKPEFYVCSVEDGVKEII